MRKSEGVSEGERKTEKTMVRKRGGKKRRGRKKRENERKYLSDLQFNIFHFLYVG